MVHTHTHTHTYRVAFSIIPLSHAHISSIFFSYSFLFHLIVVHILSLLTFFSCDFRLNISLCRQKSTSYTPGAHLWRSLRIAHSLTLPRTQNYLSLTLPSSLSLSLYLTLSFSVMLGHVIIRENRGDYHIPHLLRLMMTWLEDNATHTPGLILLSHSFFLSPLSFFHFFVYFSSHTLTLLVILGGWFGIRSF